MSFTFEIAGDASKAERAIASVEQGLGRIAPAAQRASDVVARLNQTISGGLAVAGVGIAGRELIGIADGYTQIQNRLRLLAGDQEHANELFTQLQGVATRTRSDLTATVDAFQSMTRATQNMGLSQQAALRVTETLNKLVTVSGKSATESAAGLMQFSQALSSGRLQGDELRSVFENMPTLVDALMKSLHVTQAELRQMGSEGKITSEVMIAALQGAASSVDESLGKTVPTISQQITLLKNNLMANLGPALQSATSLAMQFGDAIGSVNDHLGGLHLGMGTVAGFMAGGPFGAAIGTMIESSNALAERYGRVSDAMNGILDETNDLIVGLQQGSVSAMDLVKSGHSVVEIRELMRVAQERNNEATRQAAAIVLRLGESMGLVARGPGQLFHDMIQKHTAAWLQQKAAADAASAQVDKFWNGATKFNNLQLERTLDAIFPKEKSGRAHAAAQEIDEYAQALQSVLGPQQEAVRQLNLLGQLQMNGAITLEQYNRAAERHRNLLIELDILRVKSQTGGAINVDPAYAAMVEGLSLPGPPGVFDPANMEAFRQNMTLVHNGVIEMQESLRRITLQKQIDEARQLGEQFAPLGNAIRNAFMTGELSARSFEDALKQIAMQMVLMGIARGIGGGGGAFFAGAFGLGGSGVPGHAEGTQFTVGGSSGRDANLYMMRLTKGERVTVETEADQRSGKYLGGGAGASVRIVNNYQDDPRVLRESMSTREGEQIIHNTMMRARKRRL